MFREVFFGQFYFPMLLSWKLQDIMNSALESGYFRQQSFEAYKQKLWFACVKFNYNQGKKNNRFLGVKFFTWIAIKLNI